MKIALTQLYTIWENKKANIIQVEELSLKASSLGSEIIIFPEMTLTGFTMNTKLSAEDPEQSPSIIFFSQLAKRYRLWIIAGVVLRAETKALNTLVAFSPNGCEKVRYTKIHPFSFAGEDRFFQPGTSLAKIQIAEFSFGFSICYDLRFPELYSALSKDCDVLVNIANWPERRVNHWNTLLQARAIENQTYMIGVNRIGIDGNGLKYIRSSMVVNANGDFIDPIITEGEIDVFELNKQELIDFRNGFSTRQDRRPDFYRQVI
ncbi:MAG: carbon-nitrogen family hydrolase [Bacteroidia bacterium]|nr:carbon-nitrogen family hydrolase [Bacteroidia bacterium]